MRTRAVEEAMWKKFDMYAPFSFRPEVKTKFSKYYTINGSPNEAFYVENDKMYVYKIKEKQLLVFNEKKVETKILNDKDEVNFDALPNYIHINLL